MTERPWTGQLKQLLRSDMTAEDHAWRHTITTAEDDATCVRLIQAYWRDLDRAERTPREYLYFDIGLLSGTAERLLAEAGNFQP